MRFLLCEKYKALYREDAPKGRIMKAGARYLQIQRQELIGGYLLARGGIPKGPGIRPVYGGSKVVDLKPMK
jgi:hypothetical protein